MGQNIIGKNIVKYRKKKGFSQNDLAEATKLSRRAIAYYEKEANNEIFEKLELISNALNINLVDLFKNENSSTTDNEISDLDTRIIKRIMQVKNLSVRDQNLIWKYIDFIIDQKNKQLQDAK